MKTVIRTDRAPLRKPVITSHGFYRADAHVARAGIYEYRNDDGSIRRELRPAEEVGDPESLASYDTAPVTLSHPLKPDGTHDEVTADNVRRLKVGTVAGAARMDDDHVAATVQVEDAAAIRKAKAGTQELSPGYRIVLDEKPGADSRYGYAGNPDGRYDAVQRKIRVNHVALVDRARGGSTTRLRIDHAEGVLRDDAGGGNPNHDDHGRFAAGSSSAAHAATAAAASPAGHQHAAQLHERAAADHRAAGNGAMAKAHDLIAEHHKAEASASGHTGPGHEHSERATEATTAAYHTRGSTERDVANRAAAESHDTAAAVHSREGNTAAAAEHQRLADSHRSVVGTSMSVRPGPMSSPGTSRPEPPRERYVPPKASAKAKAASEAAKKGEHKLGVKGGDAEKAPLSAFLEAAKLHDVAAAEHGQGWEADYHKGVANDYREIGTGAKPRPVYSKYRGDEGVRAAMDHVDGYLAERARTDSMVRLTTVADGHQHSIDLDGSWSLWAPGSPMAGCTSYATATGKDNGHSHDWIRNADGTVTIAMSEDHTHGILDEDSTSYATNSAAPGQRSDGLFDRFAHTPEHGIKMNTPQTGSAPPPDAAEQIRLLTLRSDEADRAVTEQRSRADALATDRDGLKAELATVRERLKATEERLNAGAAAVETAAVMEQRSRADAAERELSQVKASIPAMVRQRAGLVAKASAVLGPTFRTDGLSDRELLMHSVRHLMPKEPTGAEVSDDYLRRRLDALIDDRAAYGASLSRASDTLAMRTPTVTPAPPKPGQQVRADELSWADQWKAGLGQFGTSTSQKGT